MTWLDDICDVLLSPEYPQIMGDLQKMEDGEIVEFLETTFEECVN